MTKILTLFCLALSLVFCIACGGSSGGGSNFTPPPSGAINGVTIQPDTVVLEIGNTLQFSATVTGTGSFDTTVRWFVNGTEGGSAAVGTITSAGLYTAPAAMPVPNAITVKAQAKGESSKSASSAVTVADIPFRAGGTFYPVTEQMAVTLPEGIVVQAAKDEVLVFAVEDVTRAELEGIRSELASLHGIVVGSMAEFRTIQVRVPSDSNPNDFVASARSIPGVASAGLNRFVGVGAAMQRSNDRSRMLASRRSVAAAAATVPSSCHDIQVSKDKDFDGSYWARRDFINACDAWSIAAPTTAAGTLGVVDNGLPSCQVGSPGTGCSTFIDPARLQRYNDVGMPVADDDTAEMPGGDHGVFTAGLAAANSDSPLFRGVARQNQVRFIDVMHRATGATLTELLSGIFYAIYYGARVINLSVGAASACKLSDPSCPGHNGHDGWIRFNQDLRDYLTPAVAFARAYDDLLVFAAGNTGTKDENDFVPKESGWNDTTRGAWETNALRVAAVDSTGTEACMSDMGKTVAIGAPGIEVGFGDKTENGTSFAAPLVTGAAALVRDMNNSLTAPEVRYILTHNTSTFKLIAAPAPASPCSDELYPPGPYAIWPPKLLNVNLALVDAKSTRPIKLDTLVSTPVELPQGTTKSLDLPVTLPITAVPALDVVFLIDTTSSYGNEINTLQAQASIIIDNLKSRGLDLRIGVASFADFPFAPYGMPPDVNYPSGDQAYYLNQPLTADFAAVKNAINLLDQPLHGGYDLPESQYEALYQAATGLGRDLNQNDSYGDLGDIAPSAMGWRSSSYKVIVLATDSQFHDPRYETSYPEPGAKTATSADAYAALKAQSIRVIGLSSEDARPYLNNLVADVGGQLFDLTSGGPEIAASIASGVTSELQAVRLTIERVATPSTIVTFAPDAFANVLPGATVHFNVTLGGNMRKAVMDQSYDVILWVRANGSALEKRVRIPISVPHE